MNSQIYISPQEWDLIERYLDIKVVSEKENFYAEILASLPNVQEKIAQVKAAREEIEDSIRQSKLNEFHKFVPNKNKRTREFKTQKVNLKTIWYAMAALMVVLLGIFWMMQNINSSEKIFAEHFKPDPGLRTVMSANSNYTFYEGMVAYKRREYSEAITMWQQLLLEKEDNDTLNYFLGVAFLAEGNARKSLEYLEPAKNFSKGVFIEDAAHYTALAKIKTGQLEEAKLLLRKYPSDRNNALLEDLTP